MIVMMSYIFGLSMMRLFTEDELDHHHLEENIDSFTSGHCHELNFSDPTSTTQINKTEETSSTLKAATRGKSDIQSEVVTVLGLISHPAPATSGSLETYPQW
jgi:hypothetical protein